MADIGIGALKETFRKFFRATSNITLYPIRKLYDAWFVIKSENITQVIWFTLAITSIGAIGVYLFERTTNQDIRDIGDAVWWAFVTMTTLGYGDKVPLSVGGRVIGVIVMFLGIGLVSIITASISSIFVERKIKEGRGLESITLKDHIVICGWNFVAEKILEGLILASKSGRGGWEKIDVVLVNDLDEDRVNEIKYTYSGLNIMFVKGNFTSESVLRRANISEAQSAIILSDITGGRTYEQTDERTVIGAFVIKNLAPNVKIYTEIYNVENEQHLKRAGVDEIIVSGEYSGFLLANAALSPGIPRVIKNLLTFNTGNELWSLRIPRKFIGKTFKELSDYFRGEHKAILIATMSEKSGMALDDILSGDYSVIDEFIKRKFEESGEDYFSSDEREIQINLNPDDEYKIVEGERAIVIAKERISM